MSTSLSKHEWTREAPRNAEHEARVTRREWFAERRVVWNLLNEIIADGWVISAVDDGEEVVKVGNDPVAALEAVFAVDESRIMVRSDDAARARAGSILIVLGNSAEEVISDWGWADNAIGQQFDRFVESFDTEKYAR